MSKLHNPKVFSKILFDELAQIISNKYYTEKKLPIQIKYKGYKITIKKD